MERGLLARHPEDEEVIRIIDEASVTLAREAVRDFGTRIGLGKLAIEESAIIASELAHNQIKHARGGEIRIAQVESLGVPVLEILAWDQGDGISNPKEALDERRSFGQDSLGCGLSAVYRLSDSIQLDNRIGEGLSIWVQKFPEKPGRGFEAAIFSRPFPGESISGDDAIISGSGTDFRAAVADGFGHGPLARDASSEAMRIVRESPGRNLPALMSDTSKALHEQQLRGSMMEICDYNSSTGKLSCVGVGDVSCDLYQRDEHSSFIFPPSSLGSMESGKLRYHLQEKAVYPGDILVMYTDGIRTHAPISTRSGILRKPAIVIAQELLEEYGRSNDDALVMVIRF